jgi:hypothetical protein
MIAPRVVTDRFDWLRKYRCTMSLRNHLSQETGANQRHESNEVVHASDRLVRRISTVSGTLRLVTVIGVGSIGLAFFASNMARQDRLAGFDDEPGSGIMIRSEVIRLYLPRTIIELAKRQTQQPALRTHDDLRRNLELQHQQNLWYALTVRGLQVNGELVDLTFIRRPYSDPARFAEFLDVLAAVTGNPPDLWRNLSSAGVTFIPDELSVREPREVMSELIGQPSLTAAPDSRRR